MTSPEGHVFTLVKGKKNLKFPPHANHSYLYQENRLHYKEEFYRSSLVAQQAKDLALSLLWLESLWRCGCDPWPRNFCMPWVQTKKERDV